MKGPNFVLNGNGLWHKCLSVVYKSRVNQSQFTVNRKGLNNTYSTKRIFVITIDFLSQSLNAADDSRLKGKLQSAQEW